MPPSGHPGSSAPLSLPHQGRSVASIASLYLFRMLGLFMVLPVLALYGQDYRNSTPLLLGMALGAYGFSQALLQIPFGWWSDRWGRKPVIACGLILFALGSFVAAMSDSVYGLIAGRFLQGCGAIASALMALVADSTSEQHRSKAMAAIGVSIGFSFSIALILGPMLTEWAGLRGIFWFTVLLAAVGLVILFTLVPNPKVEISQPSSETSLIKAVLSDKELLRLDWGILVLHMVLMANFVAIPGMLETVAGIDRAEHWWVYLPMLVAAFVTMMPLMLLGERRGKLKPVFIGAIATLVVVESCLALVSQAGSAYAWLLLSCLFVFFVAFNLLEASLPSQVSKMAPVVGRGSASGVYSSAQFFGAFLGGSLGGTALWLGGTTAVFLMNSLVLTTWLVIALPMIITRQNLGERVVDQSPSRVQQGTEAKQVSSEVELESV